MNMLGTRLRRGFLFCALLVIAACGGGGGGGDPPPPPPPPTVPSGTWVGTLEDPASVMRTFSVTTSGNSITAIRLNNALTGQTGTMTHRTGSIFGFTLSDGTTGGFFLNSAQTHAAFLDDEFNIGVVQLGAGTLPTFFHTDLNGSWSGQAVTVSANFATFTAVTSSASCTVPTCTVTDSGGTTTGTFTSANFTGNLVNEFGQQTGTGTQWGRWPGTHTSNSAPIAPSGSMRVFLSADKRFAATWACGSVAFPTGCKFNAWNKL
jgi:hypothetical protein